jgi:hypothetical protein
MTFLYIIYVLLAVIVVLLVVALYLPNGYFIEKSAVIHKSSDVVMEQVANLNNYAQWNPWQQSDPSCKQHITGAPKTPGHKYSWEGKKAGVGSLTLRDIDQKHVFFEFEFIKPMKSRARDNWTIEEWGTSDTKVTWQNFGNLPYPLGRLMGFVIYKMLQRQFTEGIHNLKKACEKSTTT